MVTTRYEVRLFEKAEHWYFDITVTAESEEQARKQVLRDYPTKDYRIASRFYRVGGDHV